MAEYSRSRAEMETTIVWDAEEKTAHIYTCDPSSLLKLDRLTEAHPEAYRQTWAEPGGKAKRYEAPAALIRFARPRRLSEAQARQLAEARAKVKAR